MRSRARWRRPRGAFDADNGADDRRDHWTDHWTDHWADDGASPPVRRSHAAAPAQPDQPGPPPEAPQAAPHAPAPPAAVWTPGRIRGGGGIMGRGLSHPRRCGGIAAHRRPARPLGRRLAAAGRRRRRRPGPEPGAATRRLDHRAGGRSGAAGRRAAPSRRGHDPGRQARGPGRLDPRRRPCLPPRISSTTPSAGTRCATPRPRRCSRPWPGR